MSLSWPSVLSMGPEFVLAMFSSMKDEVPLTIAPHSLHEESIKLSDPVAPSPPASTQMPTPLQLICCRVSVKTCWIRIPVETLMKLHQSLAVFLWNMWLSCVNSRYISDGVLLIAKQDANIASRKAQITHEQSRASS